MGSLTFPIESVKFYVLVPLLQFHLIKPWKFFGIQVQLLSPFPLVAIILPSLIAYLSHRLLAFSLQTKPMRTFKF